MGVVTDLRTRLITSIVLYVLMMSAILHYARPVYATEGQGSLQLVLQGYGSVNGQLLDATIHQDNSISMEMIVNNQMQTSYGSFPVAAHGVWTGFSNGTSVSGSIQNVTGKVQVFLSNANFVGNGKWSGSLKGTFAAGTFGGTITFTNSPDTEQIPQNQAIPTTGTWNATFSSSSTPVPEFNMTMVAVAFGILMLIVVVRRNECR
ncbi:MAG TPA: hypothetical protein VE862_02620 [Candidatus Acidoferrum sp.]|nr:hypothetical protein [Candidatus Acidoferrum sp.]